MKKLLRIGVTLVVVAAAVVAGKWAWDHYLNSPWTRDGKIQADVITISPAVSGYVTELNVTNNETVEKGGLLFSIDDARYQAQLAEAEAKVAQERAAFELARHQYNRRKELTDRQDISEESLETYRIRMASARAGWQVAQAKLGSALIELRRTRLQAPVDGTVGGIGLREGGYVTAGEAVMSLVRKESFYVTGYFEETKLQKVYVGQNARITLLGGGATLSGEVTSIAAGIAGSNSLSNDQMLPQVQQAFNWVRLAQRIPVDIELDAIPEDLTLSAGMTVSIYLETE
jgi:RND family efflux transporter MFP subunit